MKSETIDAFTITTLDIVEYLESNDIEPSDENLKLVMDNFGKCWDRWYERVYEDYSSTLWGVIEPLLDSGKLEQKGD